MHPPAILYSFWNLPVPTTYPDHRDIASGNPVQAASADWIRQRRQTYLQSLPAQFFTGFIIRTFREGRASIRNDCLAQQAEIAGCGRRRVFVKSLAIDKSRLLHIFLLTGWSMGSEGTYVHPSVILYRIWNPPISITYPQPSTTIA
jgi:hypothetical protein